MKINFVKQLTDLENNLLNELTLVDAEQIALPNQDINNVGAPIMLNRMLASALASDRDSGIDPVDAISWALELRKGNEIDLTKTEQEQLKNFIRKKLFTASAKNQMLICMNK